MDTTSASVEITFMQMHQPPADPAPPLPAEYMVLYVPEPEPDFYRYLHQAVGAQHLWWMRRHESDADLRKIMRHPMIGVFVLYHKAQPAGFYELDGRPQPHVNLSYFGLMPHVMGRGLGMPFLRAAVDMAWSLKPETVLVNTNNCDHPRAMPNYRKVGFVPYRTLTEIWDVPDYLGLPVPEHARIPPVAD